MVQSPLSSITSWEPSLQHMTLHAQTMTWSIRRCGTSSKAVHILQAVGFYRNFLRPLVSPPVIMCALELPQTLSSEVTNTNNADSYRMLSMHQMLYIISTFNPHNNSFM
jgi:hypothetical protein